MIDTRLEAKLGFDKIRKTVSDCCQTDYAADKTSRENFCTDAKVIKRRLDLTDEMRLILMFEDNFPVSGYIDAIPFLEPLQKEGSSISAINLAKLKTVTDTVRRATAFFGSTKSGVYPELRKLSTRVRNYPEVQRRIENILDKFGEIKDSASEELFTIRRELKSKEASLSKLANSILRDAQSAGYADADAGVSIREGKYLIPVNSSSKRKVPGFVFDESSTGKTCYIEPAEVINIENEITGLRFAEAREIARILAEFTAFLRPYIPDLIEAAAFLGELDFVMAKAKIALDIVAGVPVISENGTLQLRKARHPLLEKALKKEGREMVPLSISLSPQKRILLISGPNAGGKSVCLKTVGLLQYMFQWGMPISTSESSELPVFDRIAVSIGDDQNLENDLSTYSSFLADMRDMLETADSRTLVLIDEFGSGTEPAAGGAIAEAILSEIDHRGVYGVITTHYTNLKLYASGADTGVVNGAMLYDASRIEPLFKLEVGLPGNSFAFELARKMRLPETVVHDAETRAGEEFVGIERNLRKIVRNRRALEEKLQKVKHTDKALEELTDRYQKELEEIQASRKGILDEARKEAEEIVKGAGSRIEKTIRDIKEAKAEKEKTKAARSELQNFLGGLQNQKIKEQKNRDEYLENKLRKLRKRNGATEQVQGKTEPVALQLKVGEKVRVRENGMVGEVIRVSAKSVTLTIGNISSTMTEEKLERISSNEYRESVREQFKPRQERRDSAVTQRRLNFKTELDVRGERLADALDIVTHYIDDAIMLGMGSVRIIHGKGTGVLREEIQKYVRTIPGLSVRDEDVRNGGTGVSIVEIQ